MASAVHGKARGLLGKEDRGKRRALADETMHYLGRAVCGSGATVRKSTGARAATGDFTLIQCSVAPCTIGSDFEVLCA